MVTLWQTTDISSFFSNDDSMGSIPHVPSGFADSLAPIDACFGAYLVAMLPLRVVLQVLSRENLEFRDFRLQNCIVGKSSVLLDVKPWDDKTDMQKLEETIRSVLMACFGEPNLQGISHEVLKALFMLAQSRWK